MTAPLTGIRVVEFAGLAPGPFCGRILSDWGASVIRVDKPQAPDLDRLSVGKRSIIVNSKLPAGARVLRSLCDTSDVLIDPFRPGVLERLGLGPGQLLSSNPRLIYTRITGYGQTGPLKAVAGHDINYVAMSGLLSALGRQEGPPTPPVNILADFAGGGLMAAYGVAMALLHRSNTGEGQVVDCSMTEGAAYIGSWLYNMKDRAPIFGGGRGRNWLDSGSHFYDTYETCDGRHMAVGAVEPQFYAQLLRKLGLDADQVEQFGDWDAMKVVLRERFKTKSLDEWTKVFEGSDACVSPVLSMDEAPLHPQHVYRKSFTPGATDSQEESGSPPDTRFTPNPAPLLSESPAVTRISQDGAKYPAMGEHSLEVLRDLGYSQQQCEELLTGGAVEQNEEHSGSMTGPSLKGKL